MKTRAAVVVLAFTLPPGVVRAEIDPLEDALSRAYYSAERDLQAGKDRGEIAERLKPVVGKNRESPYYKLAATFLTDLTDSIGDPPGRETTPDERLADTRMRPWDIELSENWPGGNRPFLKGDANDPAYQLLIRERKVIDKLIPLLKSRAPARSDNPRFVSGSGLNPQPRLCDVALAIIDYHACCRFFDDPRSGAYFHQVADDRRDKVIQRVRDWWAENKDKSITAGIRDQLAHGGSDSARVWMAKALFKVGAGLKTDDKEHGLKLLRQMVNPKQWSYTSGHAATALGELGDPYALDLYHDELKSGRGSSYDRAGLALYLCQYGRRRDWELLTATAEPELRAGLGPDEHAVWSQVLWTETSDKNPYAIRIIALSLPFADRDSKYALSSAQRSLTALRRQLGKDFGYKPGGTEADLRAAVAKARAWWDTEGKATYTFDNIEKKLVPTGAPALGK
ncbi:MAG TPA: hypothetical protein VKD90_15465 [Gemmataceae bacterium]|nr:hypothetical protein [Gemmataceae bacterium]